MARRIIKIDTGKCIGCSLCVSACHEKAIGIVDGKAKLLREDYCDGLGACLPICPTEAISFEEREAVGEANQAAQEPLPCGCPSEMTSTINRTLCGEKKVVSVNTVSELKQWPVKIRLVPVSVKYFEDAHLLVAADCAAYACGDFHSRFMKNKITITGCPKFDNADYAAKLTDIITTNDIKSVTVVRMEVPCCSGIEQAATTALKNSDKCMPWQVVTLSVEGDVVEN